MENFKKDDLIRCIDNSELAVGTINFPRGEVLTIGKNYVVWSVTPKLIGVDLITVEADDGFLFTLSSNRFKLVSEIREERLNVLGI